MNNSFVRFYLSMAAWTVSGYSIQAHRITTKQDCNVDVNIAQNPAYEVDAQLKLLNLA
ncbi:MAG TPA: hypothetical protein PLK61_10530 [Nitrosomonas sp.]|nr:hypothetical protein [Nitrosomonas sp.]